MKFVRIGASEKDGESKECIEQTWLNATVLRRFRNLTGSTGSLVPGWICKITGWEVRCGVQEQKIFNFAFVLLDHNFTYQATIKI